MATVTVTTTPRIIANHPRLDADGNPKTYAGAEVLARAALSIQNQGPANVRIGWFSIQDCGTAKGMIITPGSTQQASDRAFINHAVYACAESGSVTLDVQSDVLELPAEEGL